jgi:Fe-S cluster assembly protein SufD
MMTTITESSPYQIFSITDQPDSWNEVYKNRLSTLPKSLQTKRKAAWDAAALLEFPDRKDESWRWMNYKDLPISQLEVVENGQSFLSKVTITMEDGSAELPEGVIVSSIKELLPKNPELVERCFSQSKAAPKGKFAALATALADDGLIIYLPKSMRLDGQIKVEIDLPLENSLLWTHSIILIEEDAQAFVDVDWMSSNNRVDGMHIGVMEVFVADRAHLQLDEVQLLDHKSWNINHATATLGRDANLVWNTAVVGAKSSKNFIETDLVGKGANAQIHGLMFPEQEQVVNLDTRQNHWDASTSSDLLFKSVAADQGRSIWHGMIYVDPKAQQTDAYQSNKNLVIDDSAEVKSAPGLEIHADDVKCSHGATVGSIDKDELFYLEARGIRYEDAQKLIVEGFLGEVVQSFKDEKTREVLRKIINKKMERF